MYYQKDRFSSSNNKLIGKTHRTLVPLENEKLKAKLSGKTQ
jgi:hypothetical protein